MTFFHLKRNKVGCVWFDEKRDCSRKGIIINNRKLIYMEKKVFFSFQTNYFIFLWNFLFVVLGLLNGLCGDDLNGLFKCFYIDLENVGNEWMKSNQNVIKCVSLPFNWRETACLQIFEIKIRSPTLSSCTVWRRCCQKSHFTRILVDKIYK